MTYVVIGASAAGMNGVEKLRQLDPAARIILISKDTEIYSRCMLHYYIGGERSLERMNFKTADFFTKNNIEWMKGKNVESLDENAKTVTLDSGETVAFDKLLIASGASSFAPPIPNLVFGDRIIGVRSLDDCHKIQKLAKESQNVVVIGGGLIGGDMATGLAHFDGLKVNLIERSSHMMGLQLDPHTAGRYQSAWQENGVNFYFNATVTNVILDSNNNPTHVEINGDTLVAADFVVVASGVVPNVQFLANTSIALTERKALKINESGQTSHPDIYGAGDVTGTAAIWSVAVKEGIVAAHNIVGQPLKMEDFFVAKSTMNFYNIPTMSLGLANPMCCTIGDIGSKIHQEMQTLCDNKEYTIDIQVDNHGNYKKIVHKDGRIYGALLQGDLFYAGILTQLIREKIDISKVKKSVFDIDYADFFNITETMEYKFD